VGKNMRLLFFMPIASSPSIAQRETMILTEPEIQDVLEKVKAAFPNLADWEYQNEVNEDYFGFALWGSFLLNPDELMPQRFFITFYTYKAQWNGSLTIGQHAYLWSSADVGDAHLLGTEECNSVEEAIVTIKTEIAQLFRAFSTL
jgi:hypothetical protein